MPIEFLITVVAGVGGYLLVRSFMRRRLRFVDAAQSKFAPPVAGLLTAALVLPFVLLPGVTGWTAAVAGVGAALGASSARRTLRRADWELRRLSP